jgi:hypothetical protein
MSVDRRQNDLRPDGFGDLLTGFQKGRQERIAIQLGRGRIGGPLQRQEFSGVRLDGPAQDYGHAIQFR